MIAIARVQNQSLRPGFSPDGRRWMMEAPRGLRKPRRAILALPVALAAVAVLAAIVFALAHLFMKESIPPDELHARQAAKGMEVKSREPYGPEDFTEPNEK
jgi:hypothetical protein